jgi:hypothetical protein
MGDYVRDGFGVDLPGLSTITGGGKALTESLTTVGDSLTKTAQKYEKEARAFYEDISRSAGNQKDADVAQRFFLRGLDVLDRSISYAQQAGLGGAATAAKVVEGTREALSSGFKLAGEGGTLDKIKAADTLIKATIKIADAFGASKEVTQQISQWAEVGTSCASMIVASGPMWYLGAAGCAAQALLQALSLSAPPAVGSPPGVPSAYFKLTSNPPGDEERPEITQTTIVMRDALLLAQVLKSHYGLTTLRPIYDALTWNSGAIYTSGGRPSGEGLWGRTTEVFSQGMYSQSFVNKSMPAVDLTSMLLAVAALDLTEPTSVDATQTDLVQIASRICEREWDECCHCDIAWNCGSKTQITSHEHFLGVQWYAFAGELNQAGVAVGASIGRGRVAKGLPIGSLLKFVRVDELINYFYAVSLNTRRQEEETWRLEVRRFLMPSLPVQFYRIPDSAKAFVWTHANIMCKPNMCGSPYDEYIKTGKSAADALRWRLFDDWSGDDVEAQREYAALRLMAAMSYLMRADRTNYSFTQPTADPLIAGGNVPVESVAWEVERPIDPRQVVQVAPGKYIPNTWDGGHPWDPNMGAEVKTYTTFQMLGVTGGGFTDPTAGVHYGSAWRSHTTRDGRWLCRAIIAREEHYRDIITQALRAAANAVGGTQFKIASRIIEELGVIGSQQHMLSVLKSQQTQLQLMKTPAQAEQACIAGGGYFDGECKPSAAFEQACRDAGGTPTWNEDEKFRCPGSSLTIQQLGALSLKVGTQQIASGQSPIPGGSAPGGSGGGLGTIVLLAGAAWLFTKYLK